MTVGYITPVLQAPLNIAYVHGAIMYDGYVYVCEEFAPGRVLKINPSNYNVEVVQIVDALLDIMPCNGYIWVCGGYGKLYGLYPSSLETYKNIAILPYPVKPHKLAADGNYIYACGQQGYVGKYNLATDEVSNSQIESNKTFHSMLLDGDYLYISDNADCIIRKVDKATLTQTSESTSYGCHISDDMAQDSNYVYGGFETSPYGVVKISKADLTYETFQPTGIGKCYGLFKVEDKLIYLDAGNNKIWVLTFPFLSVKAVKTLQNLTSSAGINELATEGGDYIHLTQYASNSYIIKLRYTDVIDGYLPSGYTLDEREFKNLKEIFKRQFNCDWQVTRQALYFGERDPATGWYTKEYTDHAIDMIIISREAQKTALQLGYWVNLDALGLTSDPVNIGDLIKDKFNRIWQIETVKPITTGHIVKYFVCDLREKPLYGA